MQTLAEIDHPVARIVAEYRQIEKLLQNLDSYCSEKEVRRLPGHTHAVSPWLTVLFGCFESWK